jgi:hypothetical protein
MEALVAERKSKSKAKAASATASNKNVLSILSPILSVEEVNN